MRSRPVPSLRFFSARRTRGASRGGGGPELSSLSKASCPRSTWHPECVPSANMGGAGGGSAPSGPPRPPPKSVQPGGR